MRQIDCRAPAIVRSSEQHRALSGCDAITIQIRARGGGRHHSGPIVTAEHDGTFDSARRQHDALGNDLP
jgi:hypothetical protein